MRFGRGGDRGCFGPRSDSELGQDSADVVFDGLGMRNSRDAILSVGARRQHRGQWGPLEALTYLSFDGGGSTVVRFNDFRTNPC